MSEQPSAKVVRIKRTRSKREGPEWLQGRCRFWQMS
jgi:hypothetical protein